MNTRLVVSARLALVALSVVAAASLARCFTGPGVMVPAIAAALVANVSIAVATTVSSRHRGLAAIAGLVGVVGVWLVPVWFAAGGATTFGWPTFATFATIGHDLSQSWTIFNQLRAPVPETAGFTMAAGWAVGGAALLAGWASDEGDTPLWVIAPPAAIFLFSSALGTSSWRSLGIAAEIVAICWYGVVSRALRLGREAATARVVGDQAHDRTGGFERLGLVGPAAMLVAIAALAAAVIGPDLPGATSPGLVSLRSGGLGPNAAATGQVIGPPIGQFAVSNLVQVAEEEIYQPDTTFFTVATPYPSYLVITTLNQFDGDRWTSTPVPGSEGQVVLPPLPASFPLTPIDGGKADVYSSQLSIESLGGTLVPVAPIPVEAEGSADMSFDPVTSMMQIDVGLEPNMLFDMLTEVPTESIASAPATVDYTPTVVADLQLPSGIPQSIVNLAHSIVRGDTTPVEKADDLQAYFHTGAYGYSLPNPGTGSNPAVSGGEGLQDLVQFLFVTRTGFCQQYASAYALLARIDGLPTRVAVGFIPGQEFASDQYSVTGTDVHAWPQVYLGGELGWTSFEPTPGSALPNPPAGSSGTGPHKPTKPKGGTGRTGHKSGGTQPAHNEKPPPEGGGPSHVKAPSATAHTVAAHPGALSGVVVLYSIVGLLLMSVLAAPAERFIRRRRARGPAARIIVAWRATADRLVLVGLAHHRGESFNEFSLRAAATGHLTDDADAALALLARHSTAAAFSGSPPSPGAVRDALAAARIVARAARRRAGIWRTAWAAVSPRGLLERDPA